MLLVEECRLRLDEPVDELLPELADRRVLVEPRGPIDGETVPAHRPITVRDVVTFLLGLGMDFSAPWPQPLLEAMGALGLGDGPPQPQGPPEPDEWMRRLGTLPLLYQPGERWLYNVGPTCSVRLSPGPLGSAPRRRKSPPPACAPVVGRMVDTGVSGCLTSVHGAPAPREGNPEIGQRLPAGPTC